MVQERRRFPRATVRYKINIICEGEVILGTPKDYTFHTHSENISEGGIKVLLEKELKIGSLIKLQVFITSGVPIDCKGIITWNKKVNPELTKPDVFETGIQFIELDDDDQAIISNVVKKVLTKEDRA